MQYSVKLDRPIRQRSQVLPPKSALDFHKHLDLLRKDGFLDEEIPLAGDRFFAFAIGENWFAIAQRQECRTWWRTRTFKVEILDLTPASEFQPPANGSTLAMSADRSGWTNKITCAIAPFLSFIRHPHFSIVAGFVAFVAISAIAGLAVVATGRGEANIKIKTDGDLVTGEVTVDGHQSD